MNAKEKLLKEMYKSIGDNIHINYSDGDYTNKEITKEFISKIELSFTENLVNIKGYRITDYEIY